MWGESREIQTEGMGGACVRGSRATAVVKPVPSSKPILPVNEPKTAIVQPVPINTAAMSRWNSLGASSKCTTPLRRVESRPFLGSNVSSESSLLDTGAGSSSRLVFGTLIQDGGQFGGGSIVIYDPTEHRPTLLKPSRSDNTICKVIQRRVPTNTEISANKQLRTPRVLVVVGRRSDNGVREALVYRMTTSRPELLLKKQSLPPRSLSDEQFRIDLQYASMLDGMDPPELRYVVCILHSMKSVMGPHRVGAVLYADAENHRIACELHDDRGFHSYALPSRWAE